MDHRNEKLRTAFKKHKDWYQSKRLSYEQVLEKMREKNYPEQYTKGSRLMERADELSASLSEMLFQSNPEQLNIAAAKSLFKEFKVVTKQLNEMTKPIWRQWTEAILIALVLALVLRNFIFGLYHVPTGSAETNILVGDRIWGNKMAYYMGEVKRGDLVIFDNPEFNYDRSSSINQLWQKYVGFPIPLLGLGAGPDNFVKRVIAVPGDTIEGRIEDDKTVVYLNGEKLDEPYVNNLPLIRIRRTIGFLPFGSIGPIAIPSFLHRRTTDVNYTYDPSKPLDEQPFYTMTEKEIVKGYDGQPLYQEAFSPTYVDINEELTVDAFGPLVVPRGKYWMMGDSRKNSRDSRYWHFLDEKLIHGRASFIIYSVDSEEPFWVFELLKHPIDFWIKKVRWSRFITSLGKYNGK